MYTLVKHGPKTHLTSGIYSNTQIWVRCTWINPRRSNYDAHTSHVYRRWDWRIRRIYRGTPLFTVYRYWPNFGAIPGTGSMRCIFDVSRCSFRRTVLTRVHYNRSKQNYCFASGKILIVWFEYMYLLWSNVLVWPIWTFALGIIVCHRGLCEVHCVAEQFC